MSSRWQPASAAIKRESPQRATEARLPSTLRTPPSAVGILRGSGTEHAALLREGAATEEGPWDEQFTIYFYRCSRSGASRCFEAPEGTRPRAQQRPPVYRARIF